MAAKELLQQYLDTNEAINTGWDQRYRPFELAAKTILLTILLKDLQSVQTILPFGFISNKTVA